MVATTEATPARTLAEDAVGSGSSECPAICSTANVMSVSGAEAGFGLCRCDNTTAGCMCGDCYQEIGGIVMANYRLNGQCTLGNTNCEGCVQWEYMIPPPTTAPVSRSRTTTTTTVPQLATPTPSPSASVVASPVAVATDRNSGGTSVLAILVIIVAVIVMGIVVGMTIAYYKKLNAPRRRRRKHAQPQEDAMTPEQEYVVVVYPVNEH